MLARFLAVIRQQYIGVLALFIALGGTSYAVATGSIDSRAIKNNSVRGKDIRNSTIESRDVKNRSLLAADFKAGQLPTGPQGPTGPTGAPGSARAYAVMLAANCVSVSQGATCQPTRSKGVTSIVRHNSAGSYCVTAPGLSPTTDAAVVSPDVGAGIGGAQVTAETDLNSALGTCPGNAFRVRTLAGFPSTDTQPAERADLSFTILIP